MQQISRSLVFVPASPLAVGFDEDFRKEREKCFILCGGYPSFLSGTALGGDEGIKHSLPGPAGNAGIAPRQLGLGDFAVERWLASGLISREDDLLGRVAVGGAEAGAFSDAGVHAIDGVAPGNPG